MASYHELRRRALLPLTGLALALFYLLVFVPLARHADDLDEPLEKSWHKLAASLDQSNAMTLDFVHITNQLYETRQSLALLEAAEKKAAARLELSPALRARLGATFQLVDYENERSQQMDELARQARQHQVTLDPAVLAGFPAHTVEVQEPALLWAALAFADDLLDTAVRCQVTAIHSLEVPLPLTNSLPVLDSERVRTWTEIPVETEFTASADSAARLIESLPRRADELRAGGLPEAPPNKIPLFLDRLIIKKQASDKLDEVRVWLRATGFVFRD